MVSVIRIARQDTTTTRVRGFVRLVWLCSWIGIASIPLAAADHPNELLKGEDGQRLVALWQTILDHSSGRIYNRQLLATLADDVERVDDLLGQLVEQRTLTQPVADSLRRLLHLRYQYVRESFYEAPQAVRLSAAEASRNAAQWVIEHQLAVLRSPPISKADEELSEKAQSNIVYQLTFLHHLDAFEAEVDRRGIRLKERERSGKDVDWDSFHRDCNRRRDLLIDAYRNRHLPSVREVETIMPYIVALTRESAHSCAKADRPSSPDS